MTRRAGAVHTVFLSPCGKTFTERDAVRLRDSCENLILVCGHYEGIDQRFIDECVDEEISLGDFVLTGGEIPAMAVADAVARLVPGVLGDEACYNRRKPLGGYPGVPPVFRPEVWHGLAVPKILLSGNHAAVDRWRRKMSSFVPTAAAPIYTKPFVLKPKQEKKLLKEMEDEYGQSFDLKSWIKESSRIVFFGGAGVSTESGLKDFRSQDGLYHEKYDYPPETI